MRLSSALAALAIALATFALPLDVHAQDPAAADSLFQAGRTLAEEGKWAEACDKFAASYDNDKTIGTAFNLGECSERQGKVGSALSWFTVAKAMCDDKNDPRASVAEERRAKLEPRAPHLIVRAKTRSTGTLEVRLDGQPLDLATVLGEPGDDRVVDPGEHRIEVRRGTEVLTTKTAQLEEAGRAEIELDLAEIERTHPVVDDEPPPPPEEPPPSQAPRIVGWILVGTGGLALVGATVLEVVALGEQSDSEQPGHCLDTVCTPTGADESATAGDLAEAGQWVGVAGLGLLAVGVTLVIAAPSAKPPPRAASAAPRAANLAAPPPRVTKAEVGLRAGFGRLELEGKF